MATKKDFSAINTEKQITGTDNSAVLDEIKKGHRKKALQTTADPVERARRESDVTTTSGRKGCKLPRINMAFSRPNYDYIKAMCAVQHRTMTAFLDDLVTADRLKNQEEYEQARIALQIMNEGAKKDDGKQGS